ncbi:ATP-binding protein [Mucilaginibacter sp. OK098]|uniref:ATP-binding protein n=1 Tax=Mucilaginibacter sp. OK098 TaxID=1855297 RepID=UPI0009132225|nr:ATP-binding protein [Mucilaginibacter sp. OK098]SHN36145.1 AAA domain-containing protein, putative AbiEii toxin, Type IV TA system [Mucilaginibacter sp. OK098]
MSQKKLPMYFTSLKVKNVKSFGEEQELNLLNEDGTVARWTLILGDNGVGKTTLLKCLAWMVPVPAPPKNEFIEQLRIAKLLLEDNYDVKKISEITKISEEDVKNPLKLPMKIKPVMDDLSFDVDVYDKILRFGENIETSLEASFANNCNLDKKPKEVLTISMDFARKDGKLTLVEPRSVIISEFNTPNLFAYSASRHLARKNFENQELSDPTFNLLSDLGELYDPEQVLAYLDYASIKEQLENQNIVNEENKKYSSTKLLTTLKKLIADLLPDIKNADSIVINPPINADGEKNEKIVEIQTSHGLIPLFNVSLGYQTMLSWAVDLAIRMLWLNPESDNPLNEPAVVIIDEIDLHLHPVWQRTLKAFLIRHFTKTQFICTAHSPFMAQSSETENICVVYKHGTKVIIDSNPEVVKGWSIGQVITSDLFGIDSDRSPEVTKSTVQRRKLLKKDSLNDTEKAKLDALNLEIDALPFGDNKKEADAMKILKDLAESMDITKNKNDDTNK